MKDLPIAIATTNNLVDYQYGHFLGNQDKKKANQE